MKDEPLKNKSLFWDIDINMLDYDKHTRFIIERVLLKGDLPDWFELKNIRDRTN